MPIYTNCDLCREKIDTNSSHCPNCGSSLSLQKELPQSSYKITDQYSRQTKVPNLGIKLADMFINILYLVIISIIIRTIFIDSLEIINNQSLGYFLVDRVSHNQISNFFNILLLHIISMWRMWLLLKIDPPEPFPEGYKTLITIIGAILLPLFFVVIPYFFLGIGLVLLITVIILIWFFYAPYQEKKKATQERDN